MTEGTGAVLGRLCVHVPQHRSALLIHFKPKRQRPGMREEVNPVTYSTSLMPGDDQSHYDLRSQSATGRRA